jgi:hypothetical protein
MEGASGRPRPSGKRSSLNANKRPRRRASGRGQRSNLSEKSTGSGGAGTVAGFAPRGLPRLARCCQPRRDPDATSTPRRLSFIDKELCQPDAPGLRRIARWAPPSRRLRAHGFARLVRMLAHPGRVDRQTGMTERRQSTSTRSPSLSRRPRTRRAIWASPHTSSCPESGVSTSC